MVIVAGGFELADEDCNAEAGGQGQRELQSVVRVELQFGQEVRCGNAQESARTEGQSATDHSRLFPGKVIRAKTEQHYAYRTDEGEKHIEHLTGTSRATACRHQGGNGHSIKRFVENHSQGGTQPHQSTVPVGVGGYSSSERNAIEQRVKGQAHHSPHPGQWLRGFLSQGMRRTGGRVRRSLGMRVLAFVGVGFHSTLRHVMMVVVKESLEKEHHQKPGQGPAHGLIHRVILMKGMGNEMEQRHAEHEPGHETHEYLQSRMGQMHSEQHPAAGQRSQQHQRTVDNQQRCGS